MKTKLLGVVAASAISPQAILIAVAISIMMGPIPGLAKTHNKSCEEKCRTEKCAWGSSHHFARYNLECVPKCNLKRSKEAKTLGSAYVMTTVPARQPTIFDHRNLKSAIACSRVDGTF
ncbi:MAG: hypothetical protein WBE94_12340 [Pseudolabrys sp.]|jgi:hypothetical protein